MAKDGSLGEGDLCLLDDECDPTVRDFGPDEGRQRLYCFHASFAQAVFGKCQITPW